MKKLGFKGRRWLKIAHLFLACVWMSAGLILVILGLSMKAESGQALYGINAVMKFIDDFVIIPAANGTLLTGLIYGIWTKWGFFKQRWIIVKWAITLYGIVFGTFFLGPWLNALPPIAGKLGMAALSDPAYMHAKKMNLIFGSIQVATLIFALAISVLKPWKKKSKPEN